MSIQSDFEVSASKRLEFLTGQRFKVRVVYSRNILVKKGDAVIIPLIGRIWMSPVYLTAPQGAVDAVLLHEAGHYNDYLLVSLNKLVVSLFVIWLASLSNHFNSLALMLGLLISTLVVVRVLPPVYRWFEERADRWAESRFPEGREVYRNYKNIDWGRNSPEPETSI